jgi:hypothetical protein
MLTALNNAKMLPVQLLKKYPKMEMLRDVTPFNINPDALNKVSPKVTNKNNRYNTLLFLKFKYFEMFFFIQ